MSRDSSVAHLELAFELGLLIHAAELPMRVRGLPLPDAPNTPAADTGTIQFEMRLPGITHYVMVKGSGTGNPTLHPYAGAGWPEGPSVRVPEAASVRERAERIFHGGLHALLCQAMSIGPRRDVQVPDDPMAWLPVSDWRSDAAWWAEFEAAFNADRSWSLRLGPCDRQPLHLALRAEKDGCMVHIEARREDSAALALDVFDLSRRTTQFSHVLTVPGTATDQGTEHRRIVEFFMMAVPALRPWTEPSDVAAMPSEKVERIVAWRRDRAWWEDLTTALSAEFPWDFACHPSRERDGEWEVRASRGPLHLTVRAEPYDCYATLPSKLSMSLRSASVPVAGPLRARRTFEDFTAYEATSADAVGHLRPWLEHALLTAALTMLGHGEPLPDDASTPVAGSGR